MEKSGFFNSSSGDRVYDATDFATYFRSLVSNGIFYKTADNLKVTATTGMNVIVESGSAFINGYHYQNTTPLELDIQTADGVNDRIDRVVIRWSNIDRNIQLAVNSGVPSVTTTPPDLTRNNDVYELGIADIFVARGTISIATENITDTRLDTSLCGLGDSLVSAVYD